MALWHGKLKSLIARREVALDQYRQHVADYPENGEHVEESFHRTLEAFEQTMSSIARSVQLVEGINGCLSDFATKVERLARSASVG